MWITLCFRAMYFHEKKTPFIFSSYVPVTAEKLYHEQLSVGEITKQRH